MAVQLLVIDQTSPHYLQERYLRYRVLRQPLGMAAGTERYAHEDDCIHVVAATDSRVVGCVMFHPDGGGGGGRLLQMAVDPELQGQGIGRRLVRHLEAHLRGLGVDDVHLHARHHAVGFYVKLGYREEGEPFEEVGMEHRLMRRRLSSTDT